MIALRLPLMILTIISGAAVWIFTPRPNAQQDLALFESTERTEVFQSDGKVVMRIPIFNAGTQSANILDVDGGCGCTDVLLSPMRIEPNGEALLEVRVNPDTAPPRVANIDISTGRVMVQSKVRLISAGGQGVDIKVSGGLDLQAKFPDGVFSLGQISTVSPPRDFSFRFLTKKKFNRADARCTLMGISCHIELPSTTGDLGMVKIKLDPAVFSQNSAGRRVGAQFIHIDLFGTQKSSFKVPFHAELIPPVRTVPSRLILRANSRTPVPRGRIQLIPDGFSILDIDPASLRLADNENFRLVGTQAHQSAVTLQLELLKANLAVSNGSLVINGKSSSNKDLDVVVPYTVVVER